MSRGALLLRKWPRGFADRGQSGELEAEGSDGACAAARIHSESGTRPPPQANRKETTPPADGNAAVSACERGRAATYNACDTLKTFPPGQLQQAGFDIVPERYGLMWLYESAPFAKCSWQRSP
jgi:hypothetical protein